MNIVIGTAGHIDHGKTALIKALTGKNTDRLPEEQKRGISIDLGFAFMEGENGLISFIDVPGHEKFIKNMTAGVGGIDVVLLVVSAKDGVMPQTEEHFEICRLLGIRGCIVAITKCDLADETLIQSTAIQVKSLLKNSPLETDKIFFLSTVTGEGIDELKNYLKTLPGRIERKSTNRATFLPIDRVFTVQGFGTVVTGTLINGTLRADDEISLLPGYGQSKMAANIKHERAGVKTRIRYLESHGRRLGEIPAGSRAAVNLANISPEMAARGHVLASPNTFIAANDFFVMIESLSSSEAALKGELHLHLWTHETTCRLHLFQTVTADAESPQKQGNIFFARLRANKSLVGAFGDRFILRGGPRLSTIAGGKILLPSISLPPKARSKTRAFKLLADLSNAENEKDFAAILINAAEETGISLGKIQKSLGIQQAAFEGLIDSLQKEGAILQANQYVISKKAFDYICKSLTHHIKKFQSKNHLSETIRLEEIKHSFPRIPDEVLAKALDNLAKQGAIEIAKGKILILQGDAALSEKELEIYNWLLDTTRQSGLGPPRVSELIKTAAEKFRVDENLISKIAELCISRQKLVRISAEYVIDSESLENLKAKLKEYSQNNPEKPLDVGSFKAIASVTRRHAIPLLEYLDRQRFTLRAGDNRIIRI